MTILTLAQQNLLSPMVLFFALGLTAALARSDLSIPEAIAKTLALYLMMAIGFKGGVEVAKAGIDARLLSAVGAGVALSFAIPVIGFAMLRLVSRLPVADAAAVSAHYGSISIVTFVAGTEAVRAAGLGFDGTMVAVAAMMETPRSSPPCSWRAPSRSRRWHEAANRANRWAHSCARSGSTARS